MIKVGDIGFLRALETSDLDWLYSIENNAEWWHLGISKEPWSKDVLSKYIHSQPGNLMRDGQLRLILEVEGLPLGALDVYDYDPIARKGGLGIVMNQEAQGKGLAKMAMGSFVQYLLQTIGLNMVYAVTPITNEASIALFESLQFKNSGTLRHWVLQKGQFQDAYLFQIVQA